MMATPYPPKILIPGPPKTQHQMHGVTGDATKAEGEDSISDAAAYVFSPWCRLWQTIAEVMYVYRASGKEIAPPAPLAFALSRHQKLMAVADELPDAIVRRDACSHSALMFQ
jgi:hypothetical protein